MWGIPRGMRVNNPFNLRKSDNHWIGKITPSTDSDFEQFATYEDGCHAGLKTLCNYYKLHGCDTIAKIINRYAPNSENPTSSYTDFVAKHCNVDRNNQYNVCDAGNLFKLASAIIEFEQANEDFINTKILKAEIDKVLAA